MPFVETIIFCMTMFVFRFRGNNRLFSLLRIKSFTILELFIEIPETVRVGSLRLKAISTSGSQLVGDIAL